MDPGTLSNAAIREIDALGRAFAAGPEDVPVPTCEGWVLRDLGVHVGQFCGFWAHVLCEGSGRPKPPVGDAPAEGPVGGWLAACGAALAAELEATPPATPVWTWYDADQTAGFVARRCAHELAVHRHDAESARGRPGPIDAALAADGIDELVKVLVLVRPRTGEGRGQTLHIHGTDPDVSAEWLVELLPDRVEARPGHAKGDLALRGAASDLELLLYQRPPLGEVERFGDPAVLDAFYREFTF